MLGHLRAVLLQQTEESTPIPRCGDYETEPNPDGVRTDHPADASVAGTDRAPTQTSRQHQTDYQGQTLTGGVACRDRVEPALHEGDTGADWRGCWDD